MIHTYSAEAIREKAWFVRPVATVSIECSDYDNDDNHHQVDKSKNKTNHRWHLKSNIISFFK